MKKSFKIQNVKPIASINAVLINLVGESTPLFRSIAQFKTDLDNSLLDNVNLRQTCSFLPNATLVADLEKRTKGEEYTDADGVVKTYKADAYAVKRVEDEEGNNITPFLEISLAQDKQMSYNIVNSVASQVAQSLGLTNLSSAPVADSKEPTYDDSVLDAFGSDDDNQSEEKDK